MTLQSVYTASTGGGRTQVTQEIFTVILIAIVIGWIIIALWTRVIDNFTYGLLGLDEKSTWDALLIALSISVFFVVLIWVVDQYGLAGMPVSGVVGQEENPFVGTGVDVALQNPFPPGFSQGVTTNQALALPSTGDLRRLVNQQLDRREAASLIWY